MRISFVDRNNLPILFVLLLAFSWVNSSLGSVYRLITIIALAIYLIECKGLIVLNSNKRKFINAWVIYCGYTVISFLWSGMSGLSQNTMFGMLILLGISTVFFTSKMDNHKAFIVSVSWLIGGCVFILLFLTGKTANVGFGTRQTLLILGTWTDPNEFASYFIVAIPLALYAFLENRNIIIRILSAFTIIGGFYVVLMSGSRGALLSCLFATVVEFSILMNASLKRIIVFALLTFVGYFVLINYIIPMIPQGTLNRLTLEALLTDSGSGRSQIWERGLSQFFQGNLFNIIFGYGYGGLTVITGLSYIPATTTMHNQFLQQLTCYGIVGLILYLLLLYRVFEEFRNNKRPYVGPLLGIMLMGMTLTMGPSYKILWILLFHAGLSTVVEENNNEELENNSNSRYRG